jgi:hypothetical protein
MSKDYSPTLKPLSDDPEDAGLYVVVGYDEMWREGSRVDNITDANNTGSMAYLPSEITR